MEDWAKLPNWNRREGGVGPTRKKRKWRTNQREKKGGKERARSGGEKEGNGFSPNPLTCAPTSIFPTIFTGFLTNWIKDLEQSPSIGWDGGIDLKVELKTPNSRVLHGFGEIGALPGQIGLGHRRRSL
ncbi:uncharacterized protein [Malus domestica]|uniref:uncharacterized protein n=1 Tax=Malus domestica TaxID=3750 RepID=UPI003974A556